MKLKKSMTKSQDKKMKLNRTKIKLIITIILVNILFISFIIGVSYLFDKVIETIIMTLSFFVFRSAFEKELHMKTLENCIKTTLSIFFISVMSLTPNEFSYTLPILFGFTICFVTYKVQDYLDFLVKKSTKLYRGMTKDEFKSICDVYSLENEEKKILYLYFVKKLKLWQIANELGYSESSIFKKKDTALKKIKLGTTEK